MNEELLVQLAIAKANSFLTRWSIFPQIAQLRIVQPHHGGASLTKPYFSHGLGCKVNQWEKE